MESGDVWGFGPSKLFRSCVLNQGVQDGSGEVPCDPRAVIRCVQSLRSLPSSGEARVPPLFLLYSLAKDKKGNNVTVVLNDLRD
jgi:hypothetical protein